MPTPFESAQLNLQSFDLRREPVLRAARAWYIGEFNPETYEGILIDHQWRAKHLVPYGGRLLGHGCIAGLRLLTGAIDGAAFLAAHGEIVATFGKIQPFLAELRSRMGEPELCQHMERVVMSAPDGQATLNRGPNG